MPCTKKTFLAQVAVCTLIKEIIAAYETRRRERRALKKCQSCEARDQEVQP